MMPLADRTASAISATAGLFLFYK